MLGRITTEFVEAYPADAAGVLEDAAPEVAGQVLGALPAPVAAAVLREMNPHAAVGGLAHLAPDAAAGIVKLCRWRSRRRSSCVSTRKSARR